ncbi:alcohol dehydrogenase, putative [Talaromyces stipitatus ATCC 10500]|uniref:Alcohol dehydrogenase, putative n=1 Tax=Talaromyces stipitatus (strain ATCC 10500 / CBS 375.48 / QM 6759 / NRRL 1006) TaxID=441959 RepID=B8LWB7_TALSN|nr:alcohol dehydrogenase, putative [Talaromyces stipitatus ATCC 10500]EED24228.1 alcohol dehydrogenase, putative [Talaromyces stipitatus ATCC 10500]
MAENTTTMRQWTTLMDGINNLKLTTVPRPIDLKDDQVLVKISRVALNHRDAKIINGDFKDSYPTPSHPLVPTSDASGIIVQVSDSVADTGKWTKGDRVISLMRPTHLTGPTTAQHAASGIGIPENGVLTEYRVFSAEGLVGVPGYMSLDEACTLPTAATTAWMALNWDREIDRPRRGKAVVVLLLGTGGVSIAGLQQAKALGLTVIITSSSAAKLERARQLGADYTINYKTNPDWATEVLNITSGKGADIIFETGGPATMEHSIRCIAAGGNISAIGVLSGTTSNAESAGQAIALSLIRKNATLKGINVGPKDRIEEMIRTVYVERFEVRPVIDRVFGFEEAREALEYMYGGSHLGKVIMKVD